MANRAIPRDRRRQKRTGNHNNKKHYHEKNGRPGLSKQRLLSPSPLPPLSQPHLVVAKTPPDQAKSQELRHPYRPGNVCRRHRRPGFAAFRVSPAFLRCHRDGYLRGLRDCRRIVRVALRIGTVALLHGLVHRLHLDPLRARADPAEEQGASVLPQARLLQVPWTSR